MEAVVVGASLAGQSAALALSRDGWHVTVLERASARPSGGTGIGIDRSLLTSVTGAKGALPVIDATFEQTTWGLVRAVLVKELRQRVNVRVRTGQNVLSVTMDKSRHGVVVRSADSEIRADLVIGADGFSSVVRHFVEPEQPEAIYSGYLLWRGLIDEQGIPGGFSAGDIDFAEYSASTARLVTFGVPGRDGDTRPGHRRGSFSWFDRGRTQLLRTLRLLDRDVVVGTLSGRDVPSQIVAELSDYARRHWPSPWDYAIDQNLLRREFIGTPITEHLPLRLVRDVVALIGDAAHVVSPVTGAGFHNGLLDIQALTSALRNTPRGEVQPALRKYEQQRLQPARMLVSQSQQWSRSYVGSH
jgi:2-polyprenyl-6-methoxyphenol hydroxylase-like FAD-dependent oxidoreductase